MTFNPGAEARFAEWRANTWLGPLDRHGEVVAHEAYCAGYGQGRDDEAAGLATEDVPPGFRLGSVAGDPGEWPEVIGREAFDRLDLPAIVPVRDAAGREVGIATVSRNEAGDLVAVYDGPAAEGWAGTYQFDLPVLPEWVPHDGAPPA